MKALAVIACKLSPLPVEITTTPVAKRPNAWRKRRSSKAACEARGASA
jgi:hypothetical protein